MEKVRSLIELLAKIEEQPRALHAGEVLFEEGQPGSEMYVVESGTVDLKVRGATIDTVGPGGVIGEMALVDRGPRSATAVAGADCRLVAIDAGKFDTLVQHVPGFAREVMTILARRLRRENART